MGKKPRIREGLVMPAPIEWPGSRTDPSEIALPVAGGDPIRFVGILLGVESTQPVPDLQPGDPWEGKSHLIPRWWEVASYRASEGRMIFGFGLHSVIPSETGFTTAGSPDPEKGESLLDVLPGLPPGVGPSLDHDPTGQLRRRRDAIGADLCERLLFLAERLVRAS